MDEYRRAIGLHCATCPDCGGEGECSFGRAITASAAHRLNTTAQNLAIVVTRDLIRRHIQRAG